MCWSTHRALQSPGYSPGSLWSTTVTQPCSRRHTHSQNLQEQNSPSFICLPPPHCSALPGLCIATSSALQASTSLLWHEHDPLGCFIINFLFCFHHEIHLDQLQNYSLHNSPGFYFRSFTQSITMAPQGWVWVTHTAKALLLPLGFCSVPWETRLWLEFPPIISHPPQQGWLEPVWKPQITGMIIKLNK